MKIKGVCDITGLTDRTIRYYIEEELISPSYTENYLGRKSFDFTDKDIEELKSIATLRKFDFTIEEIREIIVDTHNSTTIIQSVKARSIKLVNDGQAKLAALDSLNINQEYTVRELAEKLAAFPSGTTNPDEEHNRRTKNMVVSVIKALISLILVWLPILLSLYVLILKLRDFKYPVFNMGAVFLTLLFLLPSITIMVISKFDFRNKRALKFFCLLLCVFSIPLSMTSTWFVVTTSETTDIRNYGECTSSIELFPDFAVRDTDNDFYYNYHTGFDYTCDVYAQWILDENELLTEIERIDELFGEYSESGVYGYEYTVMYQGDFTCMIYYNSCDKSLPFEKVTDNYDFRIFAYNETDFSVRYIYCNSLENGVDQPYYLELDWD